MELAVDLTDVVAGRIKADEKLAGNLFVAHSQFHGLQHFLLAGREWLGNRRLDRLKELAPKELDMFKVAGAFKVLTDAVSEEEVNRALTERIRRGTAEALSAAGASGHGADRGDGEAGTGRNRATA